MINKIQFEILNFIYSDYDEPVAALDVLNTPFCDKPVNPAYTSRLIEDMCQDDLIDTYDTYESYSIGYSGLLHLTAKGRQAICDYDFYIERELRHQQQIAALKDIAENAKLLAETAIKDSGAAQANADRSFLVSKISLGIAFASVITSIVLHFI